MYLQNYSSYIQLLEFISKFRKFIECDITPQKLKVFLYASSEYLEIKIKKKKTEPFRIASGNEIFKDKFKNICKTCPLNIKHCR